MAQTSTTLLGSYDHKINIGPGTDISFSSDGTEHKISATSTSLSNLAQFDLITVAGSTVNNSTFTVKSVATDGLSIIVEEVITTEAAGDSVTIDHVGCVTDKVKGDGYYSQVDGVHTVSYKVLNRADSTEDFNGIITMQGTLASTPTESDWFNISSTRHESDQSTTIASYNFTGNFVYIRAKITCTNASTNRAMITSILLNS